MKRGTTDFNVDNQPIFPNKLQQTNLKIINGNDECDDGETNLNLMYCVNNQKTQSNVCQGDSGGPLLYFTNNRWYIYGIVSFTLDIKNTEKCDNTKPSFFVQVPQYIDWIKKTVFFLNAISN